MRNAATHVGVSVDVLAELPAAAFDDLVAGIVMGDRHVVLARD